MFDPGPNRALMPPALIVDLDSVERNIVRMAEFCAVRDDTLVDIRPGDARGAI